MTNAKIITVARSHIPEYVFTEAHLNKDLLTDGGIIKKAIVNSGLDRLLFQHAKCVYPVGVVEFFTNLNTKTLTTRIGL